MEATVISLLFSKCVFFSSFCYYYYLIMLFLQIIFWGVGCDNQVSVCLFFSRLFVMSGWWCLSVCECWNYLLLPISLILKKKNHIFGHQLVPSYPIYILNCRRFARVTHTIEIDGTIYYYPLSYFSQNPHSILFSFLSDNIHYLLQLPRTCKY